LAFEWRLRATLPSNSRLLGFGNLPPLFAHQGQQTVFVQNKYLVDPTPQLKSLTWPVRLRLTIERWWLWTRRHHVGRFIVQTATMRATLLQSFDAPVDVLPFIAEPVRAKKCPSNPAGARYDFLYVATGEPHKQHRRLINAWTLLAQRGEYPTLALTLSKQRFPDLCNWVEKQASNHRLQVQLLGECPATDMPGLYAASRALIYPPTYESFGLPLLEATLSGLPVLAADTDYVRDVIHPTAVFDPCSATSIAEAVTKFTFLPATLAITPTSAETFLKVALDRDVAG
jgi:glycosyltransferase involved in cell wall biosynthesis